MAIGILGRPNKPTEYRLPPSLRDRLLFDITSHDIRGEDVLVVGGGDTAGDYARLLADAGNRVALSYRGAQFARMSEHNTAALLAAEARGGVSILRGSNVARVEDEGGRPRVFFAEPRGGARIFDRVVYALGGTTPTNFLRMLGIEFDGGGPRHDQAGKTNVEGLFIVGDLVVGRAGGSITTAFNSSARAMARICARHLGCGGG